jgi:hypothetical protein
VAIRSKVVHPQLARPRRLRRQLAVEEQHVRLHALRVEHPGRQASKRRYRFSSGPRHGLLRASHSCAASRNPPVPHAGAAGRWSAYGSVGSLRRGARSPGGQRGRRRCGDFAWIECPSGFRGRNAPVGATGRSRPGVFGSAAKTAREDLVRGRRTRRARAGVETAAPVISHVSASTRLAGELRIPRAPT